MVSEEQRPGAVGSKLILEKIPGFLPSSGLKKIHWQRGIPVIEVALVILLASQFAGMTWSFVGHNSDELPRWSASRSSRSSSSAASNNYPALSQLHLFGEPVIEIPEAVIAVQDIRDIPRSQLQARVTGLVTHPVATQSIAIIRNGNREESYRIGDSIHRTSAEITMIYPDRVIVENNGQQEALLLYPNEPDRPVQQTITQGTVKEVRQQLLENPQSLMELVSITPVRQNGALLGYRVNPRSNPELFQSVGLISNDLAVSINGFDLTDTQEAMQAFRELPEARQVVLTVEREGQLQNIEVRL